MEVDITNFFLKETSDLAVKLVKSLPPLEFFILEYQDTSESKYRPEFFWEEKHKKIFTPEWNHPVSKATPQPTSYYFGKTISFYTAVSVSCDSNKMLTINYFDKSFSEAELNTTTKEIKIYYQQTRWTTTVSPDHSKYDYWHQVYKEPLSWTLSSVLQLAYQEYWDSHSANRQHQTKCLSCSMGRYLLKHSMFAMSPHLPKFKTQIDQFTSQFVLDACGKWKPEDYTLEFLTRDITHHYEITLINSCMTDDCAFYTELYTINNDKFNLAVLFDGSGEEQARCLVYPEYSAFDRIYTYKDDLRTRKMMAEFLKDEGYTNTIYGDLAEPIDISIDVTLPCEGQMPYMDSLCYYVGDHRSGTLFTKVSEARSAARAYGGKVYTIQDVRGGPFYEHDFDEDCECDACCEYARELEEEYELQMEAEAEAERDW